ncbi:MAG: NAD(P)H-hydrate dehydratase [Spirochaetales bacterium]|nr:NAD(P)H-hydrate dehydratase [Spirochaetales bacterium]
MVKIVSNLQMQQIDQKSQSSFHLDASLLMENAGIKLWRCVKEQEHLSVERPVVFVAGRGNNGGDALVMARQAFLEGFAAVIVLVPGGVSMDGLDNPTRPSESMLKAAALVGVPLVSRDSAEGIRAVEQASVIIEGLFGVGLSGPVRPPVDGVIEWMNSRNRRIISVDLPGGLYEGYSKTDPCIRAAATYTVEYPKTCMYSFAARERCGTITAVPIGFPPDLAESDLRLVTDTFPDLPKPEETSYKHRRGSCAVFAGGPGTLGAAYLAAKAAGKAGAGLVRLFLEKEVYPLLAGIMGGVMAVPYDEWAVSEELEKASSFVIGPGLTGLSVSEQGSIVSLAASLNLPGVIDAEALKAVSFPVPGAVPFVLTPHVGEFLSMGFCTREELDEDPVGFCQKAAADTGCVVVLKSYMTFIAHPDGRGYVYDRMNHTLGTGGSGDVLAGIIGGLLSGGAEPLEAAVGAVMIHGEAGRILRRRRGYFLAEELLDPVGQLSFSYRTGGRGGDA